ncbi:MAG: exodeoxyribonuclease VII large subunit [Proteobacteria bacterium]|nr:MAG: exodeoxyribonuclease VII large subunit [Pseudomonadota bacterium]PIE39898.1 MAG: exodeoxyribonuclease VII large subunit [Gammaproteobacteria bacterium]
MTTQTYSNQDIRAPFSVTDLNHQVKNLLEISFANVWVQGEISNFSRPSSGHWYFTLKDEKAQIRCAMFRNKNLKVKSLPGEGDKLVISGRVSLYTGRGDYQLIVDTLQPAGRGNLHQAFEQLKKKLLKEGLFDEENKRQLPSFPKHIGIVTSPTGAAIRDIISVFGRRCPMIELTLFPAQVQGEDAAKTLVQAIRSANEVPDLDALIVGRGGGSLEDLWPFNEESVARAIFASTIPIVSAVGHETDFTIADFVADSRAPTPSAAAEQLSPDQQELAQTIDNLEQRLEDALERYLLSKSRIIISLTERLKPPETMLSEKLRHVQDLSRRLMSSLQQRLELHKNTVDSQLQTLRIYSPLHQIEAKQARVTHLHTRMANLTGRHLAGKNEQFAITLAKLNAMSPLHTLARGYSAVVDKENRIIKSLSQTEPGQSIKVFIEDGSIGAKVTELDPSGRIL